MLTFYILEMQKTEDIFYFHLLYSQLETPWSRRCTCLYRLNFANTSGSEYLATSGNSKKLKSSFRARCYNSQLKATIKEEWTINNLEEWGDSDRALYFCEHHLEGDDHDSDTSLEYKLWVNSRNQHHETSEIFCDLRSETKSLDLVEYL